MQYTSTVPVIVDLHIAVLLNPLLNPHLVVSNAAKAMIRNGVQLSGTGNLMLEGLAKSKMAYNGLMAGVRDLQSKGVLA